jgi:hypothetical protein
MQKPAATITAKLSTRVMGFPMLAGNREFARNESSGVGVRPLLFEGQLIRE